MPFKSEVVRKCKWCDKPAKKYYIGTRFKGYLRTCGNEDCLKKAYYDNNIKQKKKFNKLRKCKICNKDYIATSSTSKWCTDCIPNKHARTIYERYKLLPKEEKELKEKNNGICPICNKRKASAIDHDHKTGKVRGYICNKCNLGLHYMEDENIINNMIKYLRGGF